jgi:hypothetical protein
LGILLLLLLLVQMLLVVLQVLLLLVVVGVMVQLCVLHLWARHHSIAAVVLPCWVDSTTTASASSSCSSGCCCCCCCCCRLSFHCCRKLWQHLLQHLVLLCVPSHCRVLIAAGDTKLRAKAVAAAAWRRLLLLLGL